MDCLGTVRGRFRVDERDPATAIADMVEHVLDVAATWLSWDGTPVRWRDRMTTPHKALRRVADHMDSLGWMP